MARKLNAEEIAETPPMRDAIPTMPEGDYEGDSYRDARRNSPIKKGDVVLVLDGDTVKRALVIYVLANYLNRKGVYVPLYNVRLETKRGEWAKAWRRFYPGHIQRGYEAAAERAPEPPKVKRGGVTFHINETEKGEFQLRLGNKIVSRHTSEAAAVEALVARSMK